MGHAGTADEYLDELVAFAKDIRMVPFRLYKEQHGYILNSLLVPLLDAAQKLWVNGVADPHTIDKSWMIATGAPQGPFAILDVVGLNTPYNLSLAKAEDDEEQARIVKALKEMIDAGKTGAAAGEGFYTYPNPEFTQDDFLK
jgi:3-hydroxybutyryl-CoA dehydrogenase